MPALRHFLSKSDSKIIWRENERQCWRGEQQLRVQEEVGLKKGTDTKGRRGSPGDKILVAFTKGGKS